MKTLLAIALGTMVAVLTIRAVSAQNDEAYQVITMGNFQCGDYLAANPQLKEQYFWWVAGYITGANSNDTAKRRLIYEVRRETAEPWLENFCRKKPLLVFASAAQCFREALAEQLAIPTMQFPVCQ